MQQLIDQGQWQGAQDKLQTITTTVATVNDVERKQELVTQWQELTVKVEAKDAAATVAPGAPPPGFPDVPVSLIQCSITTDTGTRHLDVIVDALRRKPRRSPSESTSTAASGTTTLAVGNGAPTSHAGDHRRRRHRDTVAAGHDVDPAAHGPRGDGIADAATVDRRRPRAADGRDAVTVTARRRRRHRPRRQHAGSAHRRRCPSPVLDSDAAALADSDPAAVTDPQAPAPKTVITTPVSAGTGEPADAGGRSDAGIQPSAIAVGLRRRLVE